MSKKKTHLFSREDIARSFATGITITATCGKETVITKKSWQKGRGHPICRKCTDLWSARQNGSIIMGRTPRDEPPKPTLFHYNYYKINFTGATTTWSTQNTVTWKPDH